MLGPYSAIQINRSKKLFTDEFRVSACIGSALKNTGAEWCKILQP